MSLIVKNLPVNVGDIRHRGSITGSGRSSGGGHANPFAYSCLENLIDRGAWPASVQRVSKNRTQLKRFGMHASIA